MRLFADRCIGRLHTASWTCPAMAYLAMHEAQAAMATITELGHQAALRSCSLSVMSHGSSNGAIETCLLLRPA